MSIVSYLLGPGMFFSPLIYIALYLLIERAFTRYGAVQYALKTITVLAGVSLICYALAASPDFGVLMPSRGTSKNEIPASLFLVIIGVVLATLPAYSKKIQFSNQAK
jgi:hypothetical protein